MSNRPHPGVIHKSRWFTCLLVWWVIAVLVYFLLAAKADRLTQRVIASGIQTVGTYAGKAALPLLEHDIQALTRLAQELGRLHGVLNVFIIDHKYKIITFADVDRLLPMPSASVDRQDNVTYRPCRLLDGTSAICFSADILYADTKIGEVLMAKDTNAVGAWRTAFFLTALVSFLLMGGILLVMDFRGIRPLVMATRDQLRAWSGGRAAGTDGGEIMVCPLCGCQNPLNQTSLADGNPPFHPIDHSATRRVKTVPAESTRVVTLSEMCLRGDLDWLRRKIYLRCVDIIKTLTDAQGRSRARHPAEGSKET
ncbi:hypothetical protein DESC_240025 [Desulfosarcina cetonica]|uniref:hypothetical protein n=1 Tax=Desulfosarcina cetonica TaxID=90730 RepID=UPI0006D0953C|nr:hypothetical protein [Desulfosarcina cetonica]VTR64634.1 hypothetical protein DESC_240025 [Desulfosarcina cetonica]